MTKRHSGIVHSGLWLSLAFVGACFANGDGSGSAGSSASGGTYLLACSTDADCVGHAAGARCNDGVCVDAAGKAIMVSHGGTGGTGGSGGSAGGTGTSGTGGGSGMTGTDDCSDAIPELCKVCADGSCGNPVCKSGTYVFVCPDDGSGGTGGSVDAGMGVAYPDCGSLGAGEGAMCSGPADQPAPECCTSSGADLRCTFDACTNSIPGSCSGTFQPVGGSTACGGSGTYEPCAAKNCGDSCSICDPNDKTCVETAELKVCTGTGGACVGGAVDCSPPEMCDPSGANTCGDGMACCEVGRCGPVGTTEGQCEAADPKTGGCTPCACEKQPGGCPICNSPETPILTPTGERAIAELREGDLVLSMDHGKLVAVPILRTDQMRVHNHAVVRLVFDNGSQVEISGSHPTADGGRLDALLPGDMLGDVHVLSAEMVPYAHDRTYDILPASDTGTYVAGGALIGSTLMAPRVQ